MSTLPKTVLLLTKNDMVLGEYSSYFTIACSLGISIGNDGFIVFMGEKVHPQYGDSFTPIEALKDWAKCYMIKNLSNSYTIYRFIK